MVFLVMSASPTILQDRTPMGWSSSTAMHRRLGAHYELLKKPLRIGVINLSCSETICIDR
eukprot:123115-Amphidinium_carterae.2